MSTVPGNLFHAALIVPILGIFSYLVITKKLAFLLKNKLSLALYLFLIFLSLVSTLVNAEIYNVSAMLKLWLVITFAYLITSSFHAEAFIRTSIYMMTFLSVVSLIVYVMVNFFGYELSLPIYINSNNRLYLSGYLFFYYDYQSIRNLGAFWEPGIFGTYLTLSLFCVLNMSFPHKKKCFCILLIALLSTMSTAAVVFVSLLFLFWLTLKIKGDYQQVLLLLVFSLFFLVLFININQIISFLIEFNPQMFSKLSGTEANSISIVERIESPLANVDVFLGNPYFGLGLGGQAIEYERLTTSSQTSSSTVYLSSFGIFGGVYSMFWLLGIFRQKSLNFIAKIILIAFLFSALNKEPHLYFSMTYIALFYLLNVQRNLERRIRV